MAVDLSCMDNADNLRDIILCVDLSTGGLVANFVYIVLSIFFITGITLRFGISQGMAIGGFIGSLLGIILFFAQLVSIASVMTVIMLTLIGVLMLVFDMRRQ